VYAIRSSYKEVSKFTPKLFDEIDPYREFFGVNLLPFWKLDYQSSGRIFMIFISLLSKNLAYKKSKFTPQKFNKIDALTQVIISSRKICWLTVQAWFLSPTLFRPWSAPSHSAKRRRHQPQLSNSWASAASQGERRASSEASPPTLLTSTTTSVIVVFQLYVLAFD